MPSHSQEGTGTRSSIVIAVLSLAAFMASLDLFVVNVAFADIARGWAAGVALAALGALCALPIRADRGSRLGASLQPVAEPRVG